MNFINLPLLTALTFGERIKMGLQVLVFGMAVVKAPEPVAPAPVEETAEPETSDEEIVAAITAALSVVMDKPQTSFRVVSFRRTASK